MLAKDIETVEDEIKGFYDINLKKYLFKGTSCLEIIKLAESLIKKIEKKNKQIKEMDYGERLNLTKNISIYILEKVKNHNIIEENNYLIIKDIIEKLHENRELFQFIGKKVCRCC